MDEIRFKDADGSELVIKHPIILIGKAKRYTNYSIGIVGFRCKKPEWILSKKTWYNLEQLEDGVLSFVKALEGKKIKVTIEVLEQ